MNEKKPTLYFLAGVTASGKSSVALDWAEANQAEILSCDSIALYRGMNIGAAKPSVEDQRRVRHHGLDLSKVSERYDVSQYLHYAEKIVSEVYRRKKKILVVGGSGFYLRSFFAAVVDEVVIDGTIRQNVQELYQNDGLTGLISKLKQMNPSGLGEIDQANPVRVIKALERCTATGLSIQELKEEFEKKPTPYQNFQKKTCLLDRRDEEIEILIEARTRSMISEGLIGEVETLMKLGLTENYPASSSIGYRETLSYIRGEISKDDLAKAIQLSTRQLVSKQRKWFRKYYPSDQRLIPRVGQKLSGEDLNWHSDT